jgi:hypothetical protein
MLAASRDGLGDAVCGVPPATFCSRDKPKDAFASRKGAVVLEGHRCEVIIASAAPGERF